MQVSIVQQLFLGALAIGVIAIVDAELTKEEVDIFVEEQFASYFTNCEAFVETFDTQGNNFEYCDFAPLGVKANPQTGCVKKADELVELCEETQGSPTIIYQLEAKPAFTGGAADYSEVAIKGFQKAEGIPVPDPNTGDLSFLNLCFDFVIVENLQPAPETALGVQSTFWKGYFATELCDVPVLPPCKCDDGSLTPIARYNF